MDDNILLGILCHPNVSTINFLTIENGLGTFSNHVIEHLTFRPGRVVLPRLSHLHIECYLGGDVSGTALVDMLDSRRIIHPDVLDAEGQQPTALGMVSLGKITEFFSEDVVQQLVSL